jgi:hypothetical protein
MTVPPSMHYPDWELPSTPADMAARLRRLASQLHPRSAGGVGWSEVIGILEQAAREIEAKLPRSQRP